MDIEKEFHRISKIMNDMSMEEFEDMLFDCGIGVIKPTEQIINEELKRKKGD